MRMGKFFVLLVAFIFLMQPALAAYYETNSSRLGKTDGVGNLQVMVTRYEPYPAQPGKYIDLWVKIENRGTHDVPNAEINLMPEYPFSIDSDETTLRTIGRLIPFQSALVKYTVRLDEGAVVGKNSLKFGFHENLYNPWSEGIIDVLIQPRDLDLIIESMKTIPDKIGPGEKGKIAFSIKNYDDAPAENIRLRLGLSSSDIPLAAAGTSAERRVAYIKPGETQTVEFDVMALADAASKIYKLPVELQYYDGTGKAYNSTSMFALPISGTPDLYFIIDSVSMAQKGTVGTISVKAVNPTASDIKFADITLLPSDDYEILSAPRYYVGKVDSDDYGAAEFTVYLKDTKPNYEFEVPIVATYYDSTNEKFTLSQNLVASIAKNRYGLKSGGSSSWIFILVILAVAGYFGYKRWKIKHNK